MKLIWAIVVAHVVALAFGLGGLLIAVPNPHLWADSELGVRVYDLGMRYAGATHIMLAAIAMLLAGIRFLGARRTFVFFVLAVVVSLFAELVGTTTGFPFGEYSYTSGLGYKVLGEVPFTIPLSWFYMGLASFILATVLASRLDGWRRPVAAVTGGAALLTVWDLVLDPAMAHQDLDVRFWVWFQDGSYFGMPAQNFAGWMLVGLVFIGLSRLAWRSDASIQPDLLRVSFAIYLANMTFAMAISAAVGLWWPIVISLAIGVVPAAIALVDSGVPGEPDTASRSSDDENVVDAITRRVMATGARFLLAREAPVNVDGAQNLPPTGALLLVARHYHHLLDGCALLSVTERPVRVIVAADWAESQRQRRLLEFACRIARWPVVIRKTPPGRPGRFSEPERVRYLRRAMHEAVELLSQGEVVVIFPEGYPNVDPHFTPKAGDNDFLPFERGFVRIAHAAERISGIPVPIVPVGFDYQRAGTWHITMRFGEPLFASDFDRSADLVTHLESAVEGLSRPHESEQPRASGRLSETT
jgi:carotene biosynthesis associated membrane protein